MNTSRSNRRARRGTLARTAGWLAAGAMLATAAFAPASVAAANPTSMDVACNNIVHGARSPEFVWTTVDAAGVTANWATDADHFDAANQATVVVRVCVIDAAGADKGGIDQNTENDGTQLFPWSVLGYATNPCPNNSLTFGSSVDSVAVQTKKSNLIDCPAVAGGQPTDNAGGQPTDNAGGQPTDNAGQPTDNAGDLPSDNAGDVPSDNAGDVPSDNNAGGQPTDNSGDGQTDNAGGQPTGAVLGIVGTPGLTPPPTDTPLVVAASGGSDGWRMALVLMAAVLIGSLAFSQPGRARRKA